jgi:hypothetical protein
LEDRTVFLITEEQFRFGSTSYVVANQQKQMTRQRFSVITCTKLSGVGCGSGVFFVCLFVFFGSMKFELGALCLCQEGTKLLEPLYQPLEAVLNSG